MENIHQFDPRSGYVALPSALMDLDLAPGPFRLLIELCRMANKAGECWPSLEQLSDRIGRSKAAISGYLKALRDAALVETHTQKMANGYNYRLKYRVVFWSQWREGLSPAAKTKKSAEKNERTVQPIERRVNSKNQIHEKQSSHASCKLRRSAKLESVFSNWSDLIKGAPFPTFNAPIPDKLRDETQYLLDTQAAPHACEMEIRGSLSQTWQRLCVKVGTEQLSRQVNMTLEHGLCNEDLSRLQSEIVQMWKAHWRKPPTDQQFAEIINRVMNADRDTQKLRALKQFLRRAAFAEKRLQRIETSPSLNARRAA